MKKSSGSPHWRRLGFVTVVSTLAVMGCMQSPTEEPAPDHVVVQPQIQGDVSEVAVGQALDVQATFSADGAIDTADLHIRWTLTRDDSLLVAWDAADFDSWIPEEEGTYVLVLEMEYRGKSRTQTVILIVRNTDGAPSRLRKLREGVVGYYEGTVVTPWLPPYRIAMEFREDGTYSARSTESDSVPALYYGTDEDGSEKVWELNDVRADGKGKGKITLLFGEVGTTVTNSIEDVALSADGDTLGFSMMHLNQYGPLEFSLVRLPKPENPHAPEPVMVDCVWEIKP